MIANGRDSASLREMRSLIDEGEAVRLFLGVDRVPTVINSPLRDDARPSFSLYSRDSVHVRFHDFATGDGGSLWDLLSRLWGLPFADTLLRAWNEMGRGGSMVTLPPCHVQAPRKRMRSSGDSGLGVKVRSWLPRDVEYWESYGIPLNWLRWAEVYPISHQVITKGGVSYTFAADAYAYAFVERKEGKVTVKTYQPFNKLGNKWRSKHDASVISLWEKVPEYGERICVCSSVKDALCLSANLRVPAIAPQGEGYRMSDTAVRELKRRYGETLVLFDNDATGIIDGEKLARETGFTNIVLPPFEGGKDISDLWRAQGPCRWMEIMSGLLDNKKPIMARAP